MTANHLYFRVFNLQIFFVLVLLFNNIVDYHVLDHRRRRLWESTGRVWGLAFVLVHFQLRNMLVLLPIFLLVRLRVILLRGIIL
jgi:hypothetical protein